MISTFPPQSVAFRALHRISVVFISRRRNLGSQCIGQPTYNSASTTEKVYSRRLLVSGDWESWHLE